MLHKKYWQQTNKKEATINWLYNFSNINASNKQQDNTRLVSLNVILTYLCRSHNQLPKGDLIIWWESIIRYYPC